MVTQNGGFDFAATGLFRDPPPHRPAVPGLQRVLPDGEVTYLTLDPLQAPNDLAVRADGTIFFTDPGPFPPPDPTIARVLSYSTDGRVDVVNDGFWYVNGIAFEPDGGLVVIERFGLLRLDGSGGNEHEWVIENLGPGGGDGFCLDVDGRFYVCRDRALRARRRSRRLDRRSSHDRRRRTHDELLLRRRGQTLRLETLPGHVVAWENYRNAGTPIFPRASERYECAR